VTRSFTAQPFAGLRYCREDLSSVLAPPYDVISREDQQRLYERDPHNVVRLEFGRDDPHDADDGDRYSRAASMLHQWCAQDVLGYDDAPCLYPCVHEFSHRGERRTRLGVICAVRLTPFDAGVVLPHEGTLRAPREDRRRLMLACQAQISPVFGLHDDPGGRIADAIQEMLALHPVAHAEINAERHRLWRLRRSELTDRYCESLGQGPLFIADGHHRYETALTVSRELQQANPGSPPNAAFNYVLALLCPANQPGVVILPTHRLLRLNGRQERDRLEALIEQCFERQDVECPASDSFAAARTLVERLDQTGDGIRFGVYSRCDGCRLLMTKLGAVPQDPGPGGINHLGTVIIHRLLIDPVLGPDALGSRVRYVMDEADAVRQVDEGRADYALFLRPTTVEQVKRVAAAGLRMPGKSTYFYPKAPTGLVISDISPGRTIG
jgi:uncharacterized protein (DUF1015 family)